MSFADCDALHRVWGDLQTMAHYPAPLTYDQTAKWIERNQRRYVEDGYGLWAMTLKDSSKNRHPYREEDRVIGDCGITNQQVEDELYPEIGYHLHRGFWGQGLATEAARACLDYGRKSLRLELIVAIVRDVNRPSRKVAERIGMKPWKHVERAGLPHIVYRSTI